MSDPTSRNHPSDPADVTLIRDLAPWDRRHRHNLLKRRDLALARIALAARLVIEVDRELALLGGPKRRRGARAEQFQTIQEALDWGVSRAKDRVSW